MTQKRKGAWGSERRAKNSWLVHFCLVYLVVTLITGSFPLVALSQVIPVTNPSTGDEGDEAPAPVVPPTITPSTTPSNGGEVEPVEPSVPPFIPPTNPSTGDEVTIPPVVVIPPTFTPPPFIAPTIISPTTPSTGGDIEPFIPPVIPPLTNPSTGDEGGQTPLPVISPAIIPPTNPSSGGGVEPFVPPVIVPTTPSDGDGSSQTPVTNPSTGDEGTILPSTNPSTGDEGSVPPVTNPSTGDDGGQTPITTPPTNPSNDGDGSSQTPVTNPSTGDEGTIPPNTNPSTGDEGTVIPVTNPSTGDEGTVAPVTNPSTGDEGSVSPTTNPSTGDEGTVVPVTNPSTGDEGTTPPSTTPSTGDEDSAPPTTNPSTGDEDTVVPITNPSTGDEGTTPPSTNPSTGDEGSVPPVTNPSTGDEDTVVPVTNPSTGDESSIPPATNPSTGDEGGQTPPPVVPPVIPPEGGGGGGCTVASISSPLSVAVVVGQTFSYTFAASASLGSTAITFTLGGALPAGLSFDPATGIISGIPTEAGTFNIPVTASSNCGNSTSTLVLAVSPISGGSCPIPSVSSPLSLTTSLDQSFSYTFTATSSDPSALSFSFDISTALPSGLAFSSSTAMITGTSTQSGTFNIPITVSNSCGSSNATLALTVPAAPAGGGGGDGGGGGGGNNPPASGGSAPLASSGGGGGGGGQVLLTISNASVRQIAPGTIEVRWYTNYESSSMVVYGTASTTAVGTVVPFGYQFATERTNEATTTHKVVIPGLAKDVLYYLRPVSRLFSIGYPDTVGPELSITLTDGVIFQSELSSSCPFITGYLRRGLNNDIEQVFRLQNFLKVVAKLDVDATGVFDAKTEVAVMAFQSLYYDEILKPWGEDSKATGYVYILTKQKINQMICGGAQLTPAEQQILNSYIGRETGANSTPSPVIIGLSGDETTIPSKNLTAAAYFSSTTSTSACISCGSGLIWNVIKTVILYLINCQPNWFWGVI